MISSQVCNSSPCMHAFLQTRTDGHFNCDKTVTKARTFKFNLTHLHYYIIAILGYLWEHMNLVIFSFGHNGYTHEEYERSICIDSVPQHSDKRRGHNRRMPGKCRSVFNVYVLYQRQGKHPLFYSIPSNGGRVWHSVSRNFLHFSGQICFHLSKWRGLSISIFCIHKFIRYFRPLSPRYGVTAFPFYMSSPGKANDGQQQATFSRAHFNSVLFVRISTDFLQRRKSGEYFISWSKFHRVRM